MTPFYEMSEFRTRLKTGLRTGAKKGWGSFVWICKIIIPVSFVAAVIQWTGWLSYLDFLLHPLMNVISLPAANHHRNDGKLLRWNCHHGGNSL